jgi:hypothetical protein
MGVALGIDFAGKRSMLQLRLVAASDRLVSLRPGELRRFPRATVGSGRHDICWFAEQLQTGG